MSDVFAPEKLGPLPDHTQLPESDGTFVKNVQEHPQAMLLTDALTPVLQARHPNGDYAIGQDCGIYWRITEPPERGAEAPDWFYVPGVLGSHAVPTSSGRSMLRRWSRWNSPAVTAARSEMPRRLER